MAATYLYFGEHPTTLVMETTSGFDGSAPASASPPTIKPGKVILPAEATSGLFNFHIYAIKIHNIIYNGGGNVTIKKFFKKADDTTEVESTFTTTLNQTNPLESPIILSPGEYLKFYSSGAGLLAITSQLARDKAVN